MIVLLYFIEIIFIVKFDYSIINIIIQHHNVNNNINESKFY